MVKLLAAVTAAFSTLMALYQEQRQFQVILRRQSFFGCSFYNHRVNQIKVSKTFSKLVQMIQLRASQLVLDKGKHHLNPEENDKLNSLLSTQTQGIFSTRHTRESSPKIKLIRNDPLQGFKAS